MIGDAHVYMNHVDALYEQLQRTPRAFPKLTIETATRFASQLFFVLYHRYCRDIDKISFSDLSIEGYQPHKGIRMKMAV